MNTSFARWCSDNIELLGVGVKRSSGPGKDVSVLPVTGVLLPCVSQHRKVRIGFLPELERAIVSGASHGQVAGGDRGAGATEMRQYIEKRRGRFRAAIDHLLELGCRAPLIVHSQPRL